MAKSNFLEDSILNHVLRGVAFPTLGASAHVSLHTANPTDAGTGAEVTGGSYARVAFTRNTTNWTAPADDLGTQETANNVAITFASPTANWGTVTHLGIWDAATAGNLLYHGALGTSRTINNGDNAPSFAAAALTVSEG